MVNEIDGERVASACALVRRARGLARESGKKSEAGGGRTPAKMGEEGGGPGYRPPNLGNVPTGSLVGGARPVRGTMNDIVDGTHGCTSEGDREMLRLPNVGAKYEPVTGTCERGVASAIGEAFTLFKR